VPITNINLVRCLLRRTIINKRAPHTLVYSTTESNYTDASAEKTLKKEHWNSKFGSLYSYWTVVKRTFLVWRRKRRRWIFCDIRLHSTIFGCPNRTSLTKCREKSKTERLKRGILKYFEVFQKQLESGYFRSNGLVKYSKIKFSRHVHTVC